MQKIPTLFVRNRQTHEIEPVLSDGCDWVLQGKGTATRKVDGTPVLIRGGHAYKRREVKPGRTPPAGFQHVETDEETGKEVGWVPIQPTDPCDRYFVEGINGTEIGVPPPHGRTYELVGPKVQGNTENLDRHILIPHDSNELQIARPPRIAGCVAQTAFDILRTYLGRYPHEGIVWHHPDGRRAKIKRRDFRHRWPLGRQGHGQPQPARQGIEPQSGNPEGHSRNHGTATPTQRIAASTPKE